MILVDTGVLYALADRRDAHHKACVRWYETAPRPLIVPPLVVAESCYLIGSYLGAVAEATFLEEFGPGRALSLGDLLPEDVLRSAVLVRQYADLGLGGTDASLIATAERLDIERIATVDDATSRSSGPGMWGRSPSCPTRYERCLREPRHPLCLIETRRCRHERDLEAVSAWATEAHRRHWGWAA